MCTRMSLMRQLTLNDVTKSRVSPQSLTDIPPFFNYQSSSTNTTTHASLSFYFMELLFSNNPSNFRFELLRVWYLLSKTDKI